MNRLEHDLLHEMFSYDPVTGELRWAVARGYKIKPGALVTSKQGDGYLQVQINGTSYLAHRIIWAMEHNEWPELLDHANRDKTDNRLSNLRKIDRRGNRLNSDMNSNNTSGYKGVSWHKRHQKWLARDTKGKSLGMFSDVHEAGAAATASRERAGQAAVSALDEASRQRYLEGEPKQ